MLQFSTPLSQAKRYWASGLTVLGFALGAQAAPVTTGLVQYHSFEQPGATINDVPDNSVNNWTGTIQAFNSTLNASQWDATGSIGGGLRLNGTSTTAGQAVHINADGWGTALLNPAYQQVDKGTLTFRFQAADVSGSSTQRWIYSMDDSGSAKLAFYLKGDDLIAYVQTVNETGYTATDQTKINTTIDSAIATGVWHNIIVVWDLSGSTSNGMLDIYLDGKRVIAQTPNGNQTFRLYDDAYLGASRLGTRTSVTPSSFFDGTVDEFRFYNRALTGTLDANSNLTGGELYELTTVPEPSAALLMVGGLTLLRPIIGRRVRNNRRS